MSAETDQQKQFIYWLDLVRVAAIFLVILGHVSGELTFKWGEISNGQWMIANIYGSFARISVPLFFMVSGYLLLPRSESLRSFYTKRMTKVLIPFVVWSLIYLLWYCAGHTCTPNLVWDLLLVQGTYYHLWFLYSLVSIYLILPVLRLMFRPDTDKKILWYLMGLWLVFQPGLAIANRFWDFKINIGVQLTGFVCFFILGYLLGEMILSKPGIILSVVIAMLGISVTIAGTYLLTLSSGQFDSFFYDLVSMNVILASGAAFILVRKISEAKIFTSPRIHSVSRSLASSSFGIYLIHVLVIEVLSAGIPFLHLNAFMGNPLWSIPLVSTVIFILSVLIVRVIQRIPIVNQAVP
jgi:surface polysaccharide O-acyltransferase-like enzyme